MIEQMHAGIACLVSLACDWPFLIDAHPRVSTVSFVVIGCLYYTCLTAWLVNQIVERLHILLVGDYSIAHKG